MLGKFFSGQHFEFFFFLIFPRKKSALIFMHIVSLGDNLHEMSKPFFLKKKKRKKNVINLSSSELAQRVVKVNINISDSGCDQTIAVKDILI